MSAGSSANTIEQPPESPLDVLSRAASMVEESGGEDQTRSSGSSGVRPASPVSTSDASSNTSPPTSLETSRKNGCDRVPSFKERHPKFRKNCTPDYLLAADQASMHAKIGRQNSGGGTGSGSAAITTTATSSSAATAPAAATTATTTVTSTATSEAIKSGQSGRDDDVPLDLHRRASPEPKSTRKDGQREEQEEEEGPLDMSIKKRRSESPPPPPPYRFTPLTAQRQLQHYQSPPPQMLPRLCDQSFPLKQADPAPPVVAAHHHHHQQPPPPPPPPPYPTESVRPPPPSYESATVKHGYPSPESIRRAALELEERERARRQQQQQQPARRPQPTPAVVEKERTIREITIITDSSADPLLDEHFRRSLGANYQELFKKKEDDKESNCSSSSSPPPPSRKEEPEHIEEDGKEASQGENDEKKGAEEKKEGDPVKAFQEDMEMEGYTVEDHFAKALGDTWLKIKAQQKAAGEDGGQKKAGGQDSPTRRPASPASTAKAGGATKAATAQRLVAL